MLAVMHGTVARPSSPPPLVPGVGREVILELGLSGAAISTIQLRRIFLRGFLLSSSHAEVERAARLHRLSCTTAPAMSAAPLDTLATSGWNQTFACRLGETNICLMLRSRFMKPGIKRLHRLQERNTGS